MEWGGTYDDISLSLDAGAIDMLVAGFLGGLAYIFSWKYFLWGGLRWMVWRIWCVVSVEIRGFLEA